MKEYRVFDHVIPMFCIVVSFFLGYAFAWRELEIEYHKQISKPVYIDVSETSSKIKIESVPDNIFFRVNGVLLQTGSLHRESTKK